MRPLHPRATSWQPTLEAAPAVLARDEWASEGRACQVRGDVAGVEHLRVVLWLVAEHSPGVGDRPEGARIAGNAIDDLEGHAPLVADILGLHRLDEQLSQVARRDEGAQVARVGDRVVALGIEVAL